MAENVIGSMFLELGIDMSNLQGEQSRLESEVGRLGALLNRAIAKGLGSSPILGPIFKEIADAGYKLDAIDKYLGSIGQKAKAAFSGLGVKSIDADFQRFAGHISDLGKALDQGLISQKEYNDALRKFSYYTQEYRKYQQGLMNDLDGSSQAFRRFVAEGEKAQRLEQQMARRQLYDMKSGGAGLTRAGFIGIGAAAAGAGFATEAIQSQATIARARLSLSPELFDFAKSLAFKSPYGFEKIIELTRYVKELGFQTGQIPRVMKAAADATAAMGGNEDTFHRLVKALGDIQAKGKLAAEELRQLSNVPIAAREIIADKLGISVSKLTEQMKKGMIDSQTAIDALLSGIEQRYSGVADQYSKIPAVRFEKLKDRLKLALADFADANQESVDLVLNSFEAIVGGVTKVVKAYQGLEPTTKFIVGGAGLGGIVALGTGGGLAVVAGQILQIAANLKLLGDGKLAEGVKLLTTALTTLCTNPWVITVALVGTGAALLYNSVGQTADERYKAGGNRTAANANVNNRFGSGKPGDQIYNDYEFMSQMGLLGASVLGPGNFKIDPRSLIYPKAKSEGLDDKDTSSIYRTLGLPDPIAVKSYGDAIKKATAAHLLTAQQLEYVNQEYARMKNDLDKSKAGAFIEPRTFTAPKTGAVERRFKKPLEDYNNFISTYGEVTPFDMYGYDIASKGMAGLNKQVQQMPLFFNGQFYDKNTLNGGFASSFAANGFNPAQLDAVDALKSLGIKDRVKDLQLATDAMKKLNEAMNHGAKVDAVTYKEAWIKTADEIMNAGGVLDDQSKKTYDSFKKQIDNINKLKNAWKNFGNQVSTILTDFSRSVVDLILPQKVYNGPDTHGLSSDFYGGLNTGLQNLTAQGYANPQGALSSSIDSIKNAKSLEEANRIATKVFGSIGPMMAKAIREGGVSMDQMKAAVNDLGKTLDGTEQSTKKVNIAMSLLSEIARAGLRTALEAAADAIGGKLLTALKSLGKTIGGLIMDIPGLGGLLKKIGSWIGGILGIGGGAAGGAIQATSITANTTAVSANTAAITALTAALGTSTGVGAAGSAAGAAGGLGGGIAGAAGGLMGTIGAIGSVGSMISGIIGNFQMMGMSKDLGEMGRTMIKVEHELTNLRADEWQRHTDWFTKFDQYWRDNNLGFANLFLRLGEFQNDFRAYASGGSTAAVAGAGGGVYNFTINDTEISSDPELESLANKLVDLIRRKLGI